MEQLMSDPKQTHVTEAPQRSGKITAEDLGLRWGGPTTALIASMSPIWPLRALRGPRVTPTPKTALAAVLRRESGRESQDWRPDCSAASPFGTKLLMKHTST